MIGGVLGLAVAALAISILSAVLFGLIPALQLSRSDPQAFLKEGGGLGGGLKRRRLQRLMVISQMTVSVILMVGSACWPGRACCSP